MTATTDARRRARKPAAKKTASKPAVPASHVKLRGEDVAIETFDPPALDAFGGGKRETPVQEPQPTINWRASLPLLGDPPAGFNVGAARDRLAGNRRAAAEMFDWRDDGGSMGRAFWSAYSALGEINDEIRDEGERRIRHWLAIASGPAPAAAPPALDQAAYAADLRKIEVGRLSAEAIRATAARDATREAARQIADAIGFAGFLACCGFMLGGLLIALQL